MPALDIKQQLDAAIWTLLEANVQFAALVSVGRRLKAYEDAEVRNRIQRAANDYPQVKVEIAGGALGQNAPKVFAMNSITFTSAQADIPVPITQTATVVITYDKEKAGDQTPLESSIRAALMSKWPTLGISGVTAFTIAETRGADGAGRPFCRMQITVTRRPMLSTLV